MKSLFDKKKNLLVFKFYVKKKNNFMYLIMPLIYLNNIIKKVKSCPFIDKKKKCAYAYFLFSLVIYQNQALD